jgi:hypothetical protein
MRFPVATAIKSAFEYSKMVDLIIRLIVMVVNDTSCSRHQASIPADRQYFTFEV